MFIPGPPGPYAVPHAVLESRGAIATATSAHLLVVMEAPVVTSHCGNHAPVGRTRAAQVLEFYFNIFFSMLPIVVN